MKRAQKGSSDPSYYPSRPKMLFRVDIFPPGVECGTLYRSTRLRPRVGSGVDDVVVAAPRNTLFMVMVNVYGETSGEVCDSCPAGPSQPSYPFCQSRPKSRRGTDEPPKVEGKRTVKRSKSSIRPAAVNCYQEGGEESCYLKQRPGKRRVSGR